MTITISDIYKIEQNVLRRRFYVYISKLGYLLGLGFDLFNILTAANKKKKKKKKKLYRQNKILEFSGLSDFFFAPLFWNKHKNPWHLFDQWLRSTAHKPRLENLKAPTNWDLLVFQYYNTWSTRTLVASINKVSVSKFQTPLLKKMLKGIQSPSSEQPSSTLEGSTHSRLVKLLSFLCIHWRIAFFSSSSASAGYLSKDQTGENLRMQGQDCSVGKTTVSNAIRWSPPVVWALA